MKYLRYLLWPFSLVYGAIVVIRNWFYDAGWFESTSFDLPLITVGNLAVGGAGKSPMTEYLIALLKSNYKVATLSRGYGRQTTGFIIADRDSNAHEIGDEPAQFKQKFPNIIVAVCESRVSGVERLKDDHQVILLDDAFQHRALKAGLNILLFDYNKLHGPQLMLPAGDLREPTSGKMRADILIVSKCPPGMNAAEQESIAARLKPYPKQHLFFTSIAYQALFGFGDSQQATLKVGSTVFLLTGIAGSAPLVKHLQDAGCNAVHHKYADHHTFTLKNITKLVDDFNASASADKLIITTEKDAERLKRPEILELLKNLPVMVQPIGVQFLNNEGAAFNNLIENYVRKYTTHSGIH
ncbi:tetraacyldisaccharide 4'-kinase [Mucilaginibacter ginkgonis]|nr:tetraacyldisaccharide 4'-kinase [Mucilaginibacter ginkgonis]